MSKEDIRELAEDNAIYEFNKFKKIYGNYTDEYVRHFYNKLAELRGGIDDVHTCNCQHDSNSRDNEPCCRCDSRQTNADRIRNMSDEELVELITGSLNFDCADYCDSFTLGCAFNCNKKDREMALKWLQSETEYESVWQRRTNLSKEDVVHNMLEIALYLAQQDKDAHEIDVNVKNLNMHFEACMDDTENDM